MNSVTIRRLAFGSFVLCATATRVAAQTTVAPPEETYAQQMAREQGQHPTLKINFWATWCGPCQTEFPELLTTYLWYRSRDFEFVSVALNTPDERASAQKFLDEHHSAVRNLMIDTDDVYAVQAAFDPGWESGVPFTIVLGPDGKEIYRVEGEADILVLRRKILGNLPDAGMFAGNTEYWRK